MIRQAVIEDAEQVMPLVHDAIGSIANSLAGTDDEAEAMRILSEFYREPGNRLSYGHVIVEERNGQVAGILIAYDGSRADELDKPFLDRIRTETGRTDYMIEKEPQPGEYYLDSIAVRESYRGQGIAKGLMAAFEAKAKEEGHKKLSLIVEQENDRAYALYRKMGYEEDGTLQVSGHLFRRMVKEI
ncbi:GNAT family N-acetyltransferase [Paenibacillus mesophilus]|uniref:GNAT family N-acetyltransferase n=1 Tax=Paenibacillus mesophilus TaxID=2582849 RepID=UPI00110DB04A|nr:GNAT family N-acetyltransferase [Paenibacillus mesophilus]TMV52201.1 GNAT family N-acetyltransferase [Paenibacillus mesophilus]